MTGNYDADEIIVRMCADDESDWPTRLLNSLADKPLIDEDRIVSGVPGLGRDDLSASEVRVIEAVSRGLTAEMVADVLGIAADTVKSELKAARYRLRAKNTTHACCEAIRQGLIG